MIITKKEVKVIIPELILNQAQLEIMDILELTIENQASFRIIMKKVKDLKSNNKLLRTVNKGGVIYLPNSIIQTIGYKETDKFNFEMDGNSIILSKIP